MDKLFFKENRKLQIFLMIFWLSFLEKTDAYYISYLIIGILGIVCLGIEVIKKNKVYCGRLVNFSSIVFSTLSILANYRLFADIEFPGYYNIYIRSIYKIICVILAEMGGFFIFQKILIYIVTCPLKNMEIKKNVLIFLKYWLTIQLIYFIVFFTTNYPGELSGDSISQISQFLSGTYSNHHPYYHTQLIHFCFSIGYRLFNNANAGIAIYNIVQISILSCCFAYVLYTLYCLGYSKKILICVYWWYILMPFNIVFSFTVWKDVIWSAMITFFTTAIIRILIFKEDEYNALVTYIVMFISAIGITLFRSNGFFVFIFTTVIFAFLFWKSYRKILFMFLVVIGISFIMKYPVLNNLNVAQPDFVESLSIPLQQVARVIYDENELAIEEKELIENIVQIEDIKNSYLSYISDPIKNLIRKGGNANFLEEHKLQYLQLYISLGVRYPGEYVKAYVDQTKGYWNAGYDYQRWIIGIAENEFGIERSVMCFELEQLLRVYLHIYTQIPILQIFLCIGLYVWGLLGVSIRAISKKNYISLFSAVPALMVVVSLLVSSPVYSEFRYAYSVFLCMPVVILLSFRKNF